MKNFNKPALLQYYYCLIFSAYNMPRDRPDSIEGTVKDKSNSETLIGTTVQIDGTTIGTTTDINGHFILHNLKAREVQP